MSQDIKDVNTSLHHQWLPFVAAGFAILIFISIGYLPFVYYGTSIETIHKWLIFGQGILLVILVGLAIRLTQVSNQYKKSLEIINQHFQKEIAERLHAEETKQKLERALLQGQKLQAIGTLAGGIAHDFNNILYAIMGYVEISREDVPQDSLVHKNLGKVLEGCKRGQELIARILTFSRHQHHNLVPISVKETIDGVLSLLKPTIPASVAVSFLQMCDNCTILANQTQLHQVIVNIINNAVDAMEGEGTVTIELSQISSSDQLLSQFSQIMPGKYCKITIKDTGYGMDQTTMERIFEPFYTTKEVGKGTGLGLSTVHSIIKEHQGEIIVDSQLGHGTTFTLLLPEYQESKEE